MLITLLKAKLHQARVTSCELEYNGSMTIDRDLLDLVNIHPYEKILVSNLANGERFETYAIDAPRGSGIICLNGATAHKGKKGDRLIIFAFGHFQQEEVAAHHPMIAVLDENNNAQLLPRP
ncbi:MAG: aspartate 1-decarboxylase [Kiritimatiellia bacterium]